MLKVWRDLAKYHSVTIDPSIARRPTPVGSMTDLGSTGEGLAGFLYHLKKGNYYPFTMEMDGETFLPEFELFESIVSWCRQVNFEIDDIDIDLDLSEALFRPYMLFNFGGKAEKFPFRRVSDGTVKWVALVTILFSMPSLNVIEEPENFLHPLMQRSFLDLCREILSQFNNRTIFISTHSPTLLDGCYPSELTIFAIDGGQTRAMQVENFRELQDKIEKSRFGLGHFYRTGALYGEDSGTGRR